MSDSFLDGLSDEEQLHLFPLWIEGAKLRIGGLIEQDKQLWREIALQRDTIKDYEARLARVSPADA